MNKKDVEEKYKYMFECADVNNTGGRIYPISYGFQCSEGWHPLIFKLIKDIAELDKDKSVKVHQIKEKFGGLRFYIDSGTDEMYKLISEAENKSYTICEMCGKQGKSRGDLAWVRTLCNRCYVIQNPHKLIKEIRLP